jgi:ADP-dependent NAD(P)H-hydrate dehydratase / NAD(P)H-hydrate epimerase
MRFWVTPDEMAGFDRRTIENGVPGDALMERAGAAAAGVAARMTAPGEGQVQVWCGPGNNGGDGLVLARLLRKSGYDVCVIMAAVPGRSLSHDCQTNLSRFVQSGGCVVPPSRLSALDPHPALVVDALLGTGFRGSMDGVFADCAKAMAASRCPVLAVDTPSGIDGGTGETDPLTVRADVTVTFAAPKAGLLFPPGCGLTGTLLCADIGIRVDPVSSREVAGFAEAASLLPPRPVDAHKGTFGRLLLLGGSELMPGAPQIMALGALRSGAGLVSLGVPYSAASAVSGRIPEVLNAFFLPGDVTSLPDPGLFSAAAVGPGMGNLPETTRLVSYILANWSLPLVLDADGLNCLAEPIEQLRKYRGELLLTPHPGELGRLMDLDAADSSAVREGAARLASFTGSVVLLKGKPTMVYGPRDRCCVVSTGNSGLATGGSGDLLTGIVSSLTAQGSSTMNAAILGAFVHGLAADMAVERTSGRSLLPTDVADYLGKAFLALESGLETDLISPGGRWNGGFLDHQR